VIKQKVLLGIIFLFAVAFKSAQKPELYTFPDLKFFPEIPAVPGNPTTVEGVELGRYLFYDTILSIDNTLSCGSCHRQAAAFSDAPKAFSKGINGKAVNRNTLPLFNLVWSPNFFWDGRAGSIEAQVFHPVRTENEMNLTWSKAVERVSNSKFYKKKFRAAFGDVPIDSVLITKAIAQFERTLISHNSRYDQVLNGKAYFTKEEFEGYELVNNMTRGNCLQCHPTDGNAMSTTFIFSNNGLDSVADINAYKDKGRGAITGMAADNGKFKVPSLRNIALTAPYMHDGRFATLEDVLDFYSNGIHYSPTIDPDMANAHAHGVTLTADEKKKMLAFLHTLTDSVFIVDPAFRDPYK
jgi:cytochrome c peroxidase